METTALSLLRAATGEDVNVVGVDHLAAARGTVERWRLDRELPGVGESVVVKRRDPNSELASYSEVNLRTEHVALEYLERSGAAVAPRCIAGGADVGMLVLTDLGERTVESALFGNNDREARAALVAVGQAVARLHSAPIEFDLFDRLGTWTVASRESGWLDLRREVDALRFPAPSDELNDEVAELALLLQSPGDAVAMVHGDLTPNNVVLDEQGRGWLIDFEGAGHQHIGLDLAMLRSPFVWYGRWAEVPADAREAMEESYRDVAGVTATSLQDALAVGCMAMCLLRLERLPRIADDTQPRELSERRRSQIVSTIDVAVDVASATGRFTALTHWLADMRAVMRHRWRETGRNVLCYPAFR